MNFTSYFGDSPALENPPLGAAYGKELDFYTLKKGGFRKIGSTQILSLGKIMDFPKIPI